MVHRATGRRTGAAALAPGATGDAGAPFAFAPPPTTGLMAYYRGAGTDLSGNAHNATNSGVTLSADRFGNASVAGHYVGATPTYFTVTANPSLPVGATPRAASVWVKTAGAANGMSIFMWGNAAVAGERFGEIIQSLPNGSGDYFVGQNADLAGPTPLNDSDWHNIVINYDGAIVWVYIDTRLSIHGTIALATTGQDLYIGVSKNPAVGAEPYSGEIDSLRIYNRVLTGEEREALYHEGGWQ